MIGYVFGYGSLAADAVRGRFPVRVATLLGHVRVWDVAMDNTEEIRGYKYYAHAVSGERPGVCVTFCDLARAAGRECVGLLLEVDDAALEELDRRERNYDRIPVSELIRPDDGADLAGPVWTYVGTQEARQRYASAVAAGRAVVARGYLDTVEAGFRELDLWPRYASSTRTPECAIVDLERVDLP